MATLGDAVWGSAAAGAGVRPASLTYRLDAVAARVLDILLSLAALIFLAPLFIVVSVAVYVTDPGPIFFGHWRVCRGGRPFRCWKFRSMVTDAETRLAELLARDPAARAQWALDHKLKNDPRITPIGRFLRRSSLDEIPQLINVLLGEMSIVGPRPIVQAEAGRYGRHYAAYCAVKPGITGLWQISGRNDVSYRRRIALDVAYARTRSVAFDIKIIFLTVPAVVKAHGSY